GSGLRGGWAPGAMPWHAVFGNRLAAALIRWLYGVSLTDLGPFRAARCEMLRALDLREMTYGWAVELVTRGAMRGYRVMEGPVSYHPRIGVSQISGTLRGAPCPAACSAGCAQAGIEPNKGGRHERGGGRSRIGGGPRRRRGDGEGSPGRLGEDEAERCVPTLRRGAAFRVHAARYGGTGSKARSRA